MAQRNEVTLVNGEYKVKALGTLEKGYVYQITILKKGHGRKISGKWKLIRMFDGYTSFRRVE